MAGRLATAVFESRLEADLKLLAVRLALYANDKTGLRIWPSVATLAARLGYSPRKVQRQLQRLRAAGVIVAVKYLHGGAGRATHYQFHEEALPAGQPRHRAGVVPAHAEPVQADGENHAISAQKGDTQRQEGRQSYDTRSIQSYSDDLSRTHTAAPPPADAAASVSAFTDTLTGDQESGLRASFERLWAIYPRSVAKTMAWRQFQRINPSAELTAVMFAAVEQQKRGPWGGVEPRYIPHLHTWLRQERWTDEDDFSPVSDRELAEAKRFKARTYGGLCPHEPVCASHAECLKTIALRNREPVALRNGRRPA